MSRNAQLAVIAVVLMLTASIWFFIESKPRPERMPSVDEVTGEVGGEAALSEDEPGPFLVIEVEGEAQGTIRIDLLEATAPAHTERLVQLAEKGALSGVVFHRVIDGFMAQTGDVEFGNVADLSMGRVGTGGSDGPDLQAEFSDIPFERGVVGMARSQDPDSANSQFFIMFAPAPYLNGQYTVVGEVVEGMEVVDAIKRGEGRNGAVLGQPDLMRSVTVEY